MEESIKYYEAYEDKLQQEVLKMCKSLGMLDNELLSSEDIDQKWKEWAPEYIAEALPEVNMYPEFAIACAGYAGMAVAQWWDSDWKKRRNNSYKMFYGPKGFDDMDDYIVEKVLGYGVYQTIEGNVSNSVGRRTRYAANIVGGIRPRYEAEKKVLKTLPLLKKGSKGGAVVALQHLLMLRGVVTFYNIDGIFGDKTEQAVKDFQQARGIYPDGKVGAKTWPALTAK